MVDYEAGQLSGIKENNLTQVQAAKIFDVTQPRVSDLVRGKIDLFSIDTLVNMAAAAAMKVSVDDHFGRGGSGLTVAVMQRP